MGSAVAPLERAPAAVGPVLQAARRRIDRRRRGFIGDSF
jgi:hypothetical protein